MKKSNVAVDNGCRQWLWTMAPQHLLVMRSHTPVYCNISMMVMTVVCRHAPGTLQARLAEELGLVHKEITLVMTDVQASSKLWEW
jgi:class 3 adenylate cyclase